MKRMKLKNRLNVWMYLAIGYLTVVLVGSILLVLPFASTTGSTYYVDEVVAGVSKS